MKKQFVFSHPYEYKECSKALAAIYNDIKFFPVLKSNSSDYWVSYDNSYGADRNYNGKYKHEGIDIMAEMELWKTWVGLKREDTGLA